MWGGRRVWGAGGGERVGGGGLLRCLSALVFLCSFFLAWDTLREGGGGGGQLYSLTEVACLVCDGF